VRSALPGTKTHAIMVPMGFRIGSKVGRMSRKPWLLREKKNEDINRYAKL